MRTLRRRRFLLLVAATAAMACGPLGRGTDLVRPLYARPATDEWPEEFQSLPADVQDMYRYAVVNRDVLRYMPCFCGCVAAGHRDNFDCYVRDVLPDGRVLLDTMSFG